MLKIAVIDANAISRNLLTSVLEGGGFEVVGTSSTITASMAGIVKLQPQLVCIDIGTPDDEGFGRLVWLREQLPKAMLFLVSGQFETATVQKAVSMGVHGFIVKPFNGAAVIASIRNAVIKLARQHRTQTSSASDAS